MSEENQALQRQLMQKRERELDHMKSYVSFCTLPKNLEHSRILVGFFMSVVC